MFSMHRTQTSLFNSSLRFLANHALALIAKLWSPTVYAFNLHEQWPNVVFTQDTTLLFYDDDELHCGQVVSHYREHLCLEHMIRGTQHIWILIGKSLWDDYKIRPHQIWVAKRFNIYNIYTVSKKAHSYQMSHIVIKCRTYFIFIVLL